VIEKLKKGNLTMGQYTPAVIVHDLAPPRHEWPLWIRPLPTSSHSTHGRLVVCTSSPREVVGEHVERISSVTNLSPKTVERVLEAIRELGTWAPSH